VAWDIGLLVVSERNKKSKIRQTCSVVSSYPCKVSFIIFLTFLNQVLLRIGTSLHEKSNDLTEIGHKEDCAYYGTLSNMDL
jgi:hypothetical protein